MGKNRELNSKYRDMFNEFNQKYFNGKLPRYQIRVVERISWVPCGGQCDNRKRVILITRNEESSMVGVLLHEMIHAAVGGFHGERFCREWDRLQESGAPVRLGESEAYRALPKRLTRQFVSNVADDIVAVQPAVKLWDFARWFVHNYGFKWTPTALLRSYPWIGNVLREAKREFREEQKLKSEFARLASGVDV